MKATPIQFSAQGSSRPRQKSDPSIIDLDEDDFDEVTNRDAISSDRQSDDSAPKRGGNALGEILSLSGFLVHTVTD